MAAGSYVFSSHVFFICGKDGSSHITCSKTTFRLFRWSRQSARLVVVCCGLLPVVLLFVPC